MKITADELIAQLSAVLNPTLARQVIESYVDMQRRFIASDWQPATLDGGQLCEAASRCLLELDKGKVDHGASPGDVRQEILDPNRPHVLGPKDRRHIAKVIEVVYKFRSDRGAVHISPDHDANYMDSMLIVHAGKWLTAELLRLALKKNDKQVGEAISQIVQMEHALIHELDGVPMVLAKGISATHEVLLLLNHVPSNRLSRADLRRLASNQKPQTVSTAISRLLASKDIREAANGEVALTPNGQRRILQEIVPKYAPT